MKKTYIQPVLEFFATDCAALLANSINTNNEVGNGVQLTKGEQDWDDVWGESTTNEGVW